MKKPSITELLSILDKPALLKWANRIGLEGVSLEKYRHEKMQEGTSLHKQVEEYYTDGVIPENDILQYRLPIFSEDKKILDIEKPIECEYFTGRLDIRYKHKGKTYISDFKRNQKYIYLENKLQLIAYSMCVECDGLNIISLPDFRIIPFRPKDKTHYENIIKALYTIYINKNIIENGQ